MREGLLYIGKMILPAPAEQLRPVPGNDLADDESTVKVTAKGLLQIPADDDFAAPEQPRPAGTFASEFRRLMSAGIGVSIDPALVDRACPGGFVWEQDRLTALYDLADAWPARILTGADGIVNVRPPLGVVPIPVVTRAASIFWTEL